MAGAGAALTGLGLGPAGRTAGAAGPTGPEGPEGLEGLAEDGEAREARRAREAAAEEAAEPAEDGGAAFRGMWIATVANRDFPSRPGLSAAAQRAELLDLLDLAVRRRMTAVLFQIRPSADALWPSPYEPWAQCLTGVQGADPGWDPLGTAVAEAHARGLELHAWCNPYRVAGHADPTRLAANHPVRRHPEWALTYDGRLLYNPGLPEVRRHVQDAMLDAVRRYDVDALHWDDYFYPYPVAGRVLDDDEAFARYGADFADRAAWRRNNTRLLVSEMAARIKRTKPGVAFGISPFGIWRNAATDPAGSDTASGVQTYDDLYADTRRWITERLVDYVIPQLYWNIGFPSADYAKLVPWWERTVRGTGVRLYLGEALYKVGDPAQPKAWQDRRELARHAELARRHPGVGGHCYFAAREVARDPLGALTAVLADDA
ncbi:family 10 glycosylhydrolase [Streptomyces roseicoloratus]|uniref:Family 10 glycosylhydrolase n=1 Tax=Streptomyces roseicoloratus TaxID=2508722 RepID=A0ABY9S0G5_9ACTN|nr:family 10 glycosylhydrolase [Streptomyces roseicoloratus]WMX47901.1 family 10 glycosylhydrolase [Streptomyces roseicoloratus]